jgi:hypothetical protein
MINYYDGYVNNWMDTWTEAEFFPTLQKPSIANLGIGTWLVGIWGRTIPGFYSARSTSECDPPIQPATTQD